jgi:phenylpropionate dioxygenase-like ring-hydroxylating dioxygenase large terminal subunit
VNPTEEAFVEDTRRTHYPDAEQVQLALRRCWQPIARTSDLASGPQRPVLLGEPLTVFLTESGEPAVLADRCPHRGASLSLGEVRGGAIRCPYHGWEWEGGGGRCTRIPSLADQRQIPPEARVATYPARERWGLVWTALEEPIGELPTVPWSDRGDWEVGEGEPFELPVSFGVMIENFRDVAHFAFVHKATMGAISEVVEPLEVESEGLKVRMRRAMRVGEGSEEEWDSLRAIDYRAIAPNFISAQLTFADGSRRCLLHAAREIETGRSIHYWIVGLSLDYTEYPMAEAIAFEGRLYEEDRRTVATVLPPVLSLDPAADLNTLADSFTLAYRRAFLGYVDASLASRGAQPSSNSILARSPR